MSIGTLPLSFAGDDAALGEQSGHFAEGILLLRNGITAFRATGTDIWTPHTTTLLAKACEVAIAGTFAKGEGRSMAPHRMLFFAALATLLVHRASAQDAQVMHWWTSGGESRAVAVFAKEYEKRGGTWIDGASVGPQAEHAAVLNAIAGGNPPAAFQWNIGVAVRQLAEQGLLTNLDDMARSGDWNRHLPPLLVKNITVDGHVIAVPVNLHGANWMFYSTKVFGDLQMQPPKTWDEFLAQADKIKAAGYLPIAMGGNAQQTGWLFYALLAGVGGKARHVDAGRRDKDRQGSCRSGRSNAAPLRRDHDHRNQ